MFSQFLLYTVSYIHSTINMGKKKKHDGNSFNEQKRITEVPREATVPIKPKCILEAKALIHSPEKERKMENTV